MIQHRSYIVAEIPEPVRSQVQALRGGELLSADAASELASRSFPQEEFWINTVSVYQLDDTSLDCKLLCQRTLGA